MNLLLIYAERGRMPNNKATLSKTSILEIPFTNDYIADVKKIFETTKHYVKDHVNYAMVTAYWFTGKRIVIQEQNGGNRAEYGKEIIKKLSYELTEEFGKGFSTQSLYNFRMFYQKFPDPQKFSTVWRILTWSHYKAVMRIAQEKVREWYCNLEFLGMSENKSNLESDFEQAIIDSLQKFLLEMGKGFAFVERQKLVRTENDDFYIDLVFYNFALKCFVLVDLKMGQLTHKDVGQMDFYVRLFDDVYKKQDDNPTIGILLCCR